MENTAVDEVTSSEKCKQDFPNPAKKSTDEKEENIIEDFGLCFVGRFGFCGSGFHDIKDILA